MPFPESQKVLEYENTVSQASRQLMTSDDHNTLHNLTITTSTLQVFLFHCLQQNYHHNCPVVHSPSHHNPKYKHQDQMQKV